MRNTITLNGISSDTITGLLIQELPAISKPLMRTTIEEIDGRDGDIVTELGYSAYDKEITIGLYGSFDINAVIAYFATEGTVVFSNEPDKFYRYKIIDQIDYERLVRYRTATVKLHCQPFKYPTSETPVQLGSGQTVTAEGTDVMLSETADAKFVEIKPEGDLNQPVSTGINLVDLVPITNTTLITANITTKIELDDKLGKYVIHATTTGMFPTLHLSFPNRLESGKYYAFKYTYRSSTSGANDSQRKLWFGPSWKANAWDNLDAFNASRCKVADGATELVIPESKEWTTTTRRFYVDPTQYAATSAAYRDLNLSMGYGIGYGNITSKEVWIADVMVYEITQAEWNESSYTSVDYQPYTNGVAGPSPDAPINVNAATGAQTIKVANQNLIPFPYYSSGTTSRGVTFTSNSDGSVIVNGQNNGTNQSVYFLYNKGDSANNSGNQILLPAGTYYMPKPSNTAIEYVVYGNNQYYGFSDGNNYTITLPIDTYVRQIYVQVPTRQSSVQFNNVKIFPMLTAMSGQTEKDYQKQSIQTYDLGINKNMLDLSLFKMGGMAQGQATDEDYRINNADNPIKVKPNTIYTISVKLGESVKGYRVGIHECAADGTFIRDLGWQQLVPNSYTFTTNSDAYTIKLVGSLSTTSTTVTTGSTESKTHFSSLVDFQRGCGLQLELGEKATNYVPVQKNLLDPGMMAVGYVGNDGKLVHGYATDDMCMPFFIPINPSSKVTIKIYETPSTNTPWFGMCEYSQADESSFITRQVNQTAGITSATFTVGENTHFIRVSARNLWKAKYMMVYGDTAPEQYTPYIDSLRKIDDHKDSFIKENGNWYLHRETGKANIAGIENINKSGVADNNSYYYAEGANPRYRFWDIDRSEIGTSPQSISVIKIYTRNFPSSNPYHVCHENSIGLSFNKITGDTSKIECRIGVGLSSPLNTDTLFKKWIAQNTLTVYYKLATPTNTKITDTDLIDQLEALANANSYRGTTHIDTTSDGYNLPVIIAATATGNADGTVTNAGNTYAKPKLTIYGTGNIGIYLNGNQMFQIELGSEGYITIDTEKMEAYKDSESNLKNRLVTGDYSKFRLEAGANQINFSGNINKCVVENYTRWL